MRIKRYKKAERYMSLYKNNFGFREPFQILLDGTFCQVALAHKVNIQDQLPKYLNGQCKLLTTACVIEETRRLGAPLHGAHLVVSQFPVHDCGHEKPVSASKCLSSFIIDTKNEDHYLVATQDYQLRLKIAKFAICPLLKLANNALVMEKPSDKVQSKVARTHHFLANKISDDELKNVSRLKEEEKLTKPKDDENLKRKKKRGVRGPNPLSCKKKSKTPSSAKPKVLSEEGETKLAKRRSRKKNRISNHIKEFLQEAVQKLDKARESTS